MLSLSEEISNCTKCSQLGDVANLSVEGFEKPSVEFNIYDKWKPSRLNVVFIAEAPPGNSKGYFYSPQFNSTSKETLRKGLFELLEIADSEPARALNEFMDRGYFLIDGIKCRCRKNGGQPPEEVTRMCGKTWMGSELKELKSPGKICTLGKTAKAALSQVEGFEDLDRYFPRKDCGRIVEIGGTKILLWLYPGWRNESIYSDKMDIFRNFCLA